jgi:hypothetical protein
MVPLPAGKLRSATIDALGARCIYQHDENVELQVIQRFPSARPIALHALLVRTALVRAAERPTLLLHRMDHRCDLVLASNNKVLLGNSYPATTSTDLLYFSLFALDRVARKPSDVRLNISGTALTQDDTALLERYFPDVAPAIARTDGTLAGLGVTTPERFLTLLEQRSCVS